MTSRRFETLAIYALVIVSMWSPADALGGLAEPLRYALFAAISLMLVVRWHLVGESKVPLSADWALLIAFLLYTSLSALWSEGGLNAAIKAVLIFIALAVSISIVNARRMEDIIAVFYNCMSGFLILSLLVVLLFPDVGVETGWELAGDWKGLAGQKNELGAISALVLVAALALPLRRSRLAVPGRFAMIAVAGLCLANSGSRGGQLIAAVGIASLIGLRLPGALQRLLLLAAAVFSVPLVQLVLATVELTADQIGVLGSTIDTSSRTTIWFYGLDQLRGHLFFGFGVGGFWTPARMTAFKDVHGWVLDNFHNGYITILIEGGLVGLLLLLAAIAFIVLLLLVAVGRLRDAHLGVAFAYTVMFLVSNLVENQIGRSTSPIFILFLLVSFAIRPHVARLLGRAPQASPHPRPAPRRAAVVAAEVALRPVKF
jgi:O-antigen ligase